MTGKTHAAVGLGTVLAVTQPSTVSGLVLAAGTGMLGALISDIDVGTSKSHKDADRITLIAVLLVAAEIALNYFYDFSIWERSAITRLWRRLHGSYYFYCRSENTIRQLSALPFTDSCLHETALYHTRKHYSIKILPTLIHVPFNWNIPHKRTSNQTSSYVHSEVQYHGSLSEASQSAPFYGSSTSSSFLLWKAGSFCSCYPGPYNPA